MNVVKTENVDSIGPDIMYNEFEKALYELKNGKSEGIDNISTELLKASGSRGKHEMFEICKQIYNQGKWPEDFMKSIVIPTNRKEKWSYRMCRLQNNKFGYICFKDSTEDDAATSKIQTEAFLSNDKFVFRRGCGTRDAIATLRSLYERSLEHNNKVFVCFVDYEKAFDRVNWMKMMEILSDIGVDWRDRKLIMNLYNKQSAFVRIGENLSKTRLHTFTLVIQFI